MSKQRLLEEAGLLPFWRLRTSEAAQSDAPDVEGLRVNADVDLVSGGSETVLTTTSNRIDVTEADWSRLMAEVSVCRRCPLCERRTQTVFGVGDRRPTWLFVGEGPGAEEDRVGEPFVGQAGKLLDQMLLALELTRREGVYIANSVKCRPPENRKPTDSEMAICFPFLRTQIEWLAPKVIVALGATGAQALLQTTAKIGALRGRVHDYAGIPLIATYHPAYLLRSPMEKAKVWSDLVLAMRTLAKTDQGDASR